MAPGGRTRTEVTSSTNKYNWSNRLPPVLGPLTAERKRLMRRNKEEEEEEEEVESKKLCHLLGRY